MLRQRLAEAYGTVLSAAGQDVPVVPTLTRPREVEVLAGVPVDRILRPTRSS